MTNLRERLLKRLEFEGSVARQQFWNSPMLKDSKADAHSFESGAEYEHARTHKLILALVDLFGSADELLTWAIKNHEMPNYSEVILNMQNAKAAVEAQLGET